MLEQGAALDHNNLHFDLNRAETYAPRAQFFAIFADLKRKKLDANRALETQYALFQTMLSQHKDAMHFCRNARDVHTAARAGALAAFLSVEGAELLCCDLSALTRAHAKGVRMLTLSWNEQNALCGAHADGAERGLSDLGRQFVQRCEALGVLVDVSHLSERGFWDVSEMAQRPFVASHSNARALCDHSRNLSDAQFQAITKAGGVVGINLYTEFLGASATIETVIAHLEHFLALGGAKSVAIGTDFDGCDLLSQGIRGVQDLSKIAERLLQKNYTEALVCDIFYHNLLDVVGEVCDI